MRATEAAPLVLLQRSDILDELRDVVARARDAQDREDKWGKNLSLALSSLSDSPCDLLSIVVTQSVSRLATHEPLLSTVYEHSALNTSPPFAFPTEVSQLQDDAKRKGDSLSDQVGRLQQVCF